MTTVLKTPSDAKKGGLSSSGPLGIPGLEQRKDGWAPKPDQISATPGGTMWAMTPGGTKIQWSRHQLMHYANSPLSKSPLNLPRIPGVTTEEAGEDAMDVDDGSGEEDAPAKPTPNDEDDVFGMDQ